MKMNISLTLKWTLFILASIICAGLTYYYFPKAYPIIHVDLKINRAEAVARAQQFAQSAHLGAHDSSSAASFYTDEQVKTFVELEAGGTKELVSIMEKQLYIPFNWRIRLFKPFEQHELMVLFTPEGTLYGFKETLSENEKRPILSQKEAQNKAELFATAVPWNVPFEDYRLVESSQETQPSGRIDHTFVYERTNAKIGEGFYRLKLVVSGNEVSELHRSVKVPDAFVRKYAQMRSANSNIAYLATLLMVLLYLLGCGLIGLYYLFKERWIVWRTSLGWACIVGILAASTMFNEFPLLWMEYNTALSPIGFIVQKCIGTFAYLIGFIIVLFIIFTAAESLTRRAFGNQPQLWKLFSPKAASSYRMLGFTMGGYLLVPILFSYTTLFYVFSTKWFGWWNPSLALFNPTILATYFPWLESIALSLQAGFTEECLFRAIPLASAALIGRRYGNERLWIIGTFIVQAFIFGAGHANYPAQPAYARLVELLLISGVFGWVFLRFGLYPAIITHFIYDVIWFALPLFVSTASGAWIHQSIVIICAAIPAFIVVYARLQEGSWNVLPSSLLNRSWQPIITKIKPFVTIPPAQSYSYSRKTIITIVLLGILGAFSYILTARFSADIPSFTLSRSEGARIAHQHMQDKNLSNEWSQLTFPFKHFEQHPSSNMQHRFVWQTAGKTIYQQLIGSYLVPPHWVTRYVLFNGDIERRAEEHIISLRPDGSFLRYIHKLPEAAPGASLSKDEAIKKALVIIKQQFALTPDQLIELSAIAQKQPNRLDWIITYADKNQHSLTQGQPRISVTIAGDEVVDADRFIHVPEEWERTEKNKQLIALIIQQLCRLLMYIVAIIGTLIVLRHWQPYLQRSFILLFIGLGSLFLFELFNSWPSVFSTFNTSQPFMDQLFRAFTFPAFLLLLRALVLASLICVVTSFPRKYIVTSYWKTISTGISLGLIFAGVQTFLQRVITPSEPLWPNLTALGFAVPFSTGITSLIFQYLTISITFMLALIAINWFNDYFATRKVITLLFLTIGGCVVAGMLYADNLLLFFTACLAFTLFFIGSYLFVARYDAAVIPVASSTYVVLYCLQQSVMSGYPFASLITIIAALLIASIGLFWSKKLAKC